MQAWWIIGDLNFQSREKDMPACSPVLVFEFFLIEKTKNLTDAQDILITCPMLH